MKKTILLNGQKTKVNWEAKTKSSPKFIGETISYNCGYETSEAPTTNTLIKREWIYTIEGSEYLVNELRTAKTNKKGFLLTSLFFEYKGHKFKSEKKMFEYILK